ncbi:autotransporter-associated beta strand repeat-containing protein, partial [Salmonella enterica]
SGSVVKSGDKTLTLSGANSYTGGTTISGGTLVANNVEALGT